LTARIAAACVAAALLAACSGARGVHHTVEPGQTAYRIAKAYGIDTRELLEINRIGDPRTLHAGRQLWIPGASRPIRVPPYEGFRQEPSLPSWRKFVLPLLGPVSSGFGRRGGRFHEGIDILAPEGTEVRSAGYGVVIYAGDALRGYGNAVILDHGEGITTLYAHLRDIRVESGDAVAEGAVIGTVGRSGNASTPHLHFELRVGEAAVDPEKYL
jgi:murein DD-endopeptidase MepM/ murein hydrolase activator NlpD